MRSLQNVDALGQLIGSKAVGERVQKKKKGKTKEDTHPEEAKKRKTDMEETMTSMTFTIEPLLLRIVSEM